MSSIVVFVFPGNGTFEFMASTNLLYAKSEKSHPSYMKDSEDMIKRKKSTIMTFIDPLKLLKERDILFNLIFGGTVYAMWSVATTSMEWQSSVWEWYSYLKLCVSPTGCF